MASSSTSDHGANMDANTNGMSNSTQPGSTPREGQPPQDIADPQLQLDTVSQQQDDSMEPIGVLRDQQEGTVPGFSSGVRGSVSYERPGPVPSAGGSGGGVSSISEYGCPPPPEQPHDVLPNYSQLPPPLHDLAAFAGPNAPPLRQYPGYGGPVPRHPGYQRFTPFQGQGQLLGQPPFYRWGQSGQLTNLPGPPQLPFPFPFPPPPHPAPFDRFHDRMGQTIGFTRRNFIPLSAGGDMGPGVRQRLPGWPYPAALQPPMYPPARSQVYPQVPFQMDPQMPPRMNSWIPPEMQMRGPMPMNWGAPPGPPPPHPGPTPAPVEPMPETNQAGPSAGRRRNSRTSRPSAAPQRSLRSDPDDGPENDGTGLDIRRRTTGRAQTRPNRRRKTRPTKRNKQD